MAKSLPPRPDLEWLKKTAKQRLADLRADDAGAKLHHAQHAIAEEYGFKNWRALKAHVDAASLDGEIIAAVIAEISPPEVHPDIPRAIAGTARNALTGHYPFTLRNSRSSIYWHSAFWHARAVSFPLPNSGDGTVAV